MNTIIKNILVYVVVILKQVIWNAIDKNKDGQLSEKEIKDIVNKIKNFLTGKIDKTQLQSTL